MISNFFHSISRAFLWSSGANLELLDKVPTEKSKYFGIGGTIIFTAMMAAFAGGYAFFTAFKDPYLSFFFGIFWGALIFNLDRYIVSSFGVGDGKKTISKQEIIEASPRLLMAIILGFVISTPLELKIFDREIQTAVERIKIERGQGLLASDSVFHSDLKSSKQRLTDIDNKLSDFRNNKQSMMVNEVSFIEDRKKEIKSDLTQKDGELKVAQNRVNSAYENLMKAKQGAINDSKEISRLENIYNNYLAQRNSIRNEKQIIENKITKLETEIEGQQKDLSSSINSEIQSLLTERESLMQDIKSKEVTKAEKIKNYTNVTENYDGFAAHLEGLSIITKDKPIILFSKWLITILFIFIEIAPILFKMMTERGPYDDMVDRLKHEIKVKELLAISNINEEVNTLVSIHREKSAQKLSAELAANNHLLSTISEAQAEIAKEAINEWKRIQVEAVIANPGLLIKDNIKNHI